MTPLHVLHLAFLGLWGGLVAAEFVIEGIGRLTPGQLAVTARLHFWIDLLVELPVLAGVLATGALLLARTPLDAALLAKVTAGLLAVAANLACVVLVVRRHRTADAERLARYSAYVGYTAVVGVPLGVLALVLGSSRMGWLR
jgi:hypothetical protein